MWSAAAAHSSTPNPYPEPNRNSKLSACSSKHSTKYSHMSYTYPEQFIRDNVIAPF